MGKKGVEVPIRPDISEFLAHFTTDRGPAGDDNPDNPAFQFKELSALERLIRILEQGRIVATAIPWTGRIAACFTECPWTSLLDHARRYSPYGVGFNKPLIFAAGGGPVYYVRADHWEKQDWDPHLRTFVSPFWPSYRPRPLRSRKYLSGSTVDYSHEREWRIPHDFTFSHDRVEFVVVNTYKDVAQFPKDLKDAIGRDKFLIMDVYRHIEKMWPLHKI